MSWNAGSKTGRRAFLGAVSAGLAAAGLSGLADASIPASPAPAGAQHGLHEKDGALFLNGKPFRGIGVNFVDAFLGHLANPDDPTTEQAFKALGEHRIPFIRTPASGWGGAGMKLYQTDRAEYFNRMSRTVALAEKHHVGLICSLFFSGWVKDVSGETSLDAWLDPQSKTHRIMTTYIREMASRYGSSPAIWGWEWGNELVLNCDLPNAASFGIKPQDHYTLDVMRKVYVEFGRQVRRYDPYRVIDTGDTSARPSSWHQWKEGSWTKDTPEQFSEVLSGDAPNPIDMVSIHAYGDDFDMRVPMSAHVARKLNKPLFIGEFGVKGPRTDASEKEFRSQLAAIQQIKAPLAALWEFDVKPTPRPEWLVSPTNDRFYMIEAIEGINRAWATGA